MTMTSSLLRKMTAANGCQPDLQKSKFIPNYMGVKKPPRGGFYPDLEKLIILVRKQQVRLQRELQKRPQQRVLA